MLALMDATVWEAWLLVVSDWSGARWLRASPVAYPLVNAAHILGLGLLLGAIIPLDLRLAGWARSSGLTALARALSASAGVGLALALLTGLWLFTVNPVMYARNPALLIKLGLLALAVLNLAWQHRSSGWESVLNGSRPLPAVRWRARLSLLLWLGVLVAGRWIGFV